MGGLISPALPVRGRDRRPRPTQGHSGYSRPQNIVMGTAPRLRRRAMDQRCDRWDHHRRLAIAQSCLHGSGRLPLLSLPTRRSASDANRRREGDPPTSSTDWAFGQFSVAPFSPVKMLSVLHTPRSFRTDCGSANSAAIRTAARFAIRFHATSNVRRSSLGAAFRLNGDAPRSV
jgi:hypothetical protein